MDIFTIGHSTRSLQELIGLLQENRIQALADIRAFPASRRHPHFSRDFLLQRLPEAEIEYLRLGKELGGRRQKGEPNSPHSALRSSGFRNYADHMASKEFSSGIEKLRGLAAQKRLAVMCAELLWRRCHRSLVCDYLATCHGDELLHILGEGKTEPHRLHRAARAAEGRLIYDVEDGQARLLLGISRGE